MRRTFVLLLVLVGFVRPAEALTVRDLIELSRAGLGEEVLIALIEVDRRVYPIDPATLKSLKEAGVSDRVIVALIRSGREQPAWEPPDPFQLPAEAYQPPDPQPPVVVIEHHHEAQPVMVPVPVYVPVPTPSWHRGGVRQVESTYVPFQSGPPVVRPQVVEPARPVYWGFGGKLRPDAWQPDGHKPESHHESRKDDGGKPDRK